MADAVAGQGAASAESSGISEEAFRSHDRDIEVDQMAVLAATSVYAVWSMTCATWGLSVDNVYPVKREALIGKNRGSVVASVA